MMENTNLVCPKCQGMMRTYERSGLMVDQCTDCRGIFLDHGELARLMEAENAASPLPPSVARDAMGDADYRESQKGDYRARDYDDDRGERDRGERDRDDRGERLRPGDPRDPKANTQLRRRESRLGGLFDIFGGD
jgi:Zn-finger nucleic acid-binding protein